MSEPPTAGRGERRRNRFKIVLLLAALTAGLAAIGDWLWDPYPATAESFDRGLNGLWLGHQWFTGRNVRSKQPVSAHELTDLLRDLERYRIRYAYVHVGPIQADGSIPDKVGELFHVLRRASPNVIFYAWLGARVEKIDLNNPAWRDGVVKTAYALRDLGFAGVHFDLEPLRDWQPGYLVLLQSIRSELGHQFLLSQATPRIGPFGWAGAPFGKNFWSKEFYLRTMDIANQSVVMAYDTKISFSKLYVAYVRQQTALLTRWGCKSPEHEVLIGVPSYEDNPAYSDPRVENIANAALGVRAALEAKDKDMPCFTGISVYAQWVTDEQEWKQFEDYWLTAGRRG